MRRPLTTVVNRKVGRASATSGGRATRVEAASATVSTAVPVQLLQRAIARPPDSGTRDGQRTQQARHREPLELSLPEPEDPRAPPAPGHLWPVGVRPDPC